MDVKDKTVVLTGTFAKLKRAAARAALENAGARVTESVSAKTDMLFAGEAWLQAGAGNRAQRSRFR